MLEKGAGRNDLVSSIFHQLTLKKKVFQCKLPQMFYLVKVASNIGISLEILVEVAEQHNRCYTEQHGPSPSLGFLTTERS